MDSWNTSDRPSSLAINMRNVSTMAVSDVVPEKIEVFLNHWIPQIDSGDVTW